MKSEDELYAEAVALVRAGKPSASYVQRRLQLNYDHAAALVARMEREGIVSAMDLRGRRELLKGALL